MSNDLERRLETMLAEAPEPDPGAGEEALHRRAAGAPACGCSLGAACALPSSSSRGLWSCS
jgi:hypothetical protein